MHCRVAKMEAGRQRKLVIEEDQRRYDGSWNLRGNSGETEVLAGLKYSLGEGLAEPASGLNVGD